jgi:hypothetical protein
MTFHRKLQVAYQVVSLSKQDHKVLIQILKVEGHQPAVIQMNMSAVCGAACVSKAAVVDWLHILNEHAANERHWDCLYQVEKT